MGEIKVKPIKFSKQLKKTLKLINEINDMVFSITKVESDKLMLAASGDLGRMCLAYRLTNDRFNS